MSRQHESANTLVNFQTTETYMIQWAQPHSDNGSWRTLTSKIVCVMNVAEKWFQKAPTHTPLFTTLRKWWRAFRAETVNFGPLRKFVGNSRQSCNVPRQTVGKKTSGSQPYLSCMLRTVSIMCCCSDAKLWATQSKSQETMKNPSSTLDYIS